MRSRLLDQATVYVNNRDKLSRVKEEALDFIKFYDQVTQISYEIGICQYELIENTRIYL